MGKLIIISGSSGSGKTTICHKLSERFPQLKFSVSATTRSPREGEKDGVDYYYFSRDRFQELIKQSALIEWEEVHGNLYGTLKKTIEDTVNSSNYLILDIDPKGALHLKEMYPDSLTIFLDAENAGALLKRLRGRKTESEEQIARRMARIREENLLSNRFDYHILNTDLEHTTNKVASLIEKFITV